MKGWSEICCFAPWHGCLLGSQARLPGGWQKYELGYTWPRWEPDQPGTCLWMHTLPFLPLLPGTGEDGIGAEQALIKEKACSSPSLVPFWFLKSL